MRCCLSCTGRIEPPSSFEDLDIILGQGVSVDLANVQAKLVAARRGGYCCEHGLLFGAVLDRLGFRVDRLLARM